MNAGQLKEILSRVEDDAEVFCANLTELKNSETGKIILTVDSKNAFPVRKIVPSVKYDEGSAKPSLILGIHPVAKDLHESETNITVLETEQ